MTRALPVVVRKACLTARSHGDHVVPVLIAEAGEDASWRYVQFFTANIRNPHTRRAFARSCGQFLAWCETRGLSLTTIRPHDVGAYVEGLQVTHTAPTVKQQLAAVRMLLDWLVIGQVMPNNPAAAVRGPKHVVTNGKTPVLDSKEWRQLLDSIPTETVRDLRDRALIATGLTLAPKVNQTHGARVARVDLRQRQCHHGRPMSPPRLPDFYIRHHIIGTRRASRDSPL